MIEPSAMARDEQRRKEQEADAAQRRLIGVTAEGGNEQLHGRARTERARDMREELQAVARDNRAGLADDANKERAEDRAAMQRGNEVRGTINAPHKLVCRGLQFAITIAAPVAQPGGQGSESSDSSHPFKLVDASDGAIKIQVLYGTVNGTAPTGMSFGDVPPLILTVTVTGVIYIKLEVDADGVITSRTIASATSMPSDDLDAGEFYQQIGSYNITGSDLTIAQAISGSQAFELCGGVEPLWGLV